VADLDIKEILRRDAATLHRFGYAQELSRRMSAFSNFAMSFMIIGVFASVCVDLQQGISTAGMFGITIGWLAGCLIACATAASLGEISSAIPTAGGIYHWASVLGGRGWGWASAWVNLLAYMFTLGGTAVSAYLLFKQMILGWIFHFDTSGWGYGHQCVGVLIIIGSQAIFNHFGVRALARLGQLGAYVTFAGATTLFVLLLFNIRIANIPHALDFVNNTGNAGGDVVPHTSNLLLIFGYALLLPLWIISSYDASAHTSEETVDASRAVPKAMINSVLLSSITGIGLLVALGLAMKDPAGIARQGVNAFATLFGEISAPVMVKNFIPATLVLANYIGGACILTGFSRAVFSFARDRGLPTVLKGVSVKHRTPAPAIWTCAAVGVAATLYSPAFDALVAGTALFYQFSYGMAILPAMLVKRRTYGPYRLGMWSKPLGAIAIMGGVLMIWVGVHPPTSILINYIIAVFALLLIGWWAVERRRFPGPPMGELAIRERQTEIHAHEAALSENASAKEHAPG
jgi:amino acid transporter